METADGDEWAHARGMQWAEPALNCTEAHWFALVWSESGEIGRDWAGVGLGRAGSHWVALDRAGLGWGRAGVGLGLGWVALDRAKSHWVALD